MRRTRARRSGGRLLLVTLGVVGAALAQASSPHGAEALLSPPPAAATRCPVPAELRPTFVAASRATGVRLGLLAAVARVESEFDEGARSHAGAIGVLQLMPTTAAALHYDPEEAQSNVMAGALYLSQLLSRYGSTELALAAYNAGPTAVDLQGSSPNAETAAYVERVEAARRAYGNCS